MKNPILMVVALMVSTQYVGGQTITASNIEQVRYADQFPGADFGAQIMAAYHDLTNNNIVGGVIEIAASPTCRAISTPLVFSTPVILRGQGSGNSGQYGQIQTNSSTPEATCLSWNFSTGAAITVTPPLRLPIFKRRHP